MTTLPPQDEDKMSELIEGLRKWKGNHGHLMPGYMRKLLEDAIDSLQSSAAREALLRDEARGYAENCDRFVSEIAEMRKELDQLRGVKGEPVALPPELSSVAETVADGDGFWRSCSGCHELNEGHDTGTYSDIFKCALGLGCRECGGLGVVWDSTDYEAMGAALSAEPVSEPNAEAVADDAELEGILGDMCTGAGNGFSIQEHVEALRTLAAELTGEKNNG